MTWLKNFKIITKFGSEQDFNLDFNTLEKIFYSNLKNLNINYFDTVLIHIMIYLYGNMKA